MCFEDFNRAEIATNKAKIASKIENKWRREKRKDSLLYELRVELCKGGITRDQVFHILSEQPGVCEDVSYYEEISIPNENEPIVIAFGLTIENAVKEEIYDDELLSDHQKLCDELELDLKNQLSSLVSCKFFVTEDLFDGEAFSIRIAFENLNPEEIKKFQSELWEILEIKWFSEIYE
ncbi:MAG: hypothetical protein M0Q91_06855 [Methanoregula sp.]|jgi:hypothetical protein|nr:hypothetical protein [Methanoregula sp.]